MSELTKAQKKAIIQAELDEIRQLKRQVDDTISAMETTFREAQRRISTDLAPQDESPPLPYLGKTKETKPTETKEDLPPSPTKEELEEIKFRIVEKALANMGTQLNELSEQLRKLPNFDDLGKRLDRLQGKSSFTV